MLWLYSVSMQVVAYDFGIKHNILRRLASYGCSITVVPADYPADKVMDLNPDGVFFSNGPVSGHAQTLQGHPGISFHRGIQAYHYIL
jgi:carbamoylphosphate synthase small subunit